MKLLIAYPKHLILKETLIALEKEGYACKITNEYDEAEEWMSLYEFDCIILSDEWRVGVWSMLEMLEKNKKTDGLIILSANPLAEYRVKLLDHGADDVLSFPFDGIELLARIRAVVRRKVFSTKNKLHFANLIVDFHSKSVHVWNQPVNLTKKEYEILLYLISRRNAVVSKKTLSEYLWGEESDELESYNILVVHLKNLRKKLSEAKAEIEIKNQYGVGYQIIEL